MSVIVLTGWVGRCVTGRTTQAKQTLEWFPTSLSLQELKEEFKPLTKWWKKLLGSSVTNVKVSTRLASTPCVVVAGKYGQSANMERIMRAQVGACAIANPWLLRPKRGCSARLLCACACLSPMPGRAGNRGVCMCARGRGSSKRVRVRA